MASTAISSAAIAKLREASKTLVPSTVLAEGLETCAAMCAELDATPFEEDWALSDPQYVAAVNAAYIPKEGFLRLIQEICTMATEPGRQCAATTCAEYLMALFNFFMCGHCGRSSRLHHHYHMASQCGYDLSWLMTDVPRGPTVLGLKALCMQSSTDYGIENRMEYMLEGVFFRKPGGFDAARVVEGAYHFFLAMFDLPGADRGLVNMTGFSFYMPERVRNKTFVDMCSDAATFLREYPHYMDVYDAVAAEEKMHPDVAELFKVMRDCTTVISLKLGDSSTKRRVVGGMCGFEALEAGRLYVAAIKKKHYRRLWREAVATRTISLYWQESSVKRACADQGRARSEDLAALHNMCA